MTPAYEEAVKRCAEQIRQMIDDEIVAELVEMVNRFSYNKKVSAYLKKKRKRRSKS